MRRARRFHMSAIAGKNAGCSELPQMRTSAIRMRMRSRESFSVAASARQNSALRQNRTGDVAKRSGFLTRSFAIGLARHAGGFLGARGAAVQKWSRPEFVKVSREARPTRWLAKVNTENLKICQRVSITAIPDDGRVRDGWKWRDKRCHACA